MILKFDNRELKNIVILISDRYLHIRRNESIRSVLKVLYREELYRGVGSQQIIREIIKLQNLGCISTIIGGFW